MKLELKTDNENYSRILSKFLSIFLKVALIIIFCDVALKLGNISRNYLIQYNCKLLSVEKSKTNFKNLSRISNLKSKQKIWDLCREFVK